MLRRWPLLTLILIGSWAPAEAFGQAPAGGPDLSQAVRQVIDQTNQFRQAEGRAAVTANATLAQTAQDFAGFMARTDIYGHEANGQKPAERAKAHGYQYCLIAENIAYVFRTSGFTTEELAKQFVEGWKNSPPHRKNMLEPDVTETGVAIARSPDTGIYYAVQMFGRPESLRFQFVIVNSAGVTIPYTVAGQKYELRPRYTMTHQVCRPEDVTFQWPGASEGGKSGGGTQTIRPGRGERYVVTGANAGGFTVKKE